MMQDIILFAAVTACYAVFYRGRLRTAPFKMKKNEAIFSAAAFIFTAGSIALRHFTCYGPFLVPAAWMGILFLYNILKGGLSPVSYLYFILLISAFLSPFILPLGAFTPYIFIGSLFVVIIMTAEIFRSILSFTSFIPSFVFMVFSVYSLKYVFLESLTPFISVPVAFCAALFYFVRKGKEEGYYLEESNASRTLAVIYPLFMLQCLAAVLLKNGIFF
jgi:hypothetical protein